MSADSMPKLSRDLHRVHADDRQIVGNHLHVEPTAPLELVPLRLRYEIPPNFQVFQRPFVRPSLEDIVRHHIIVAKRRNDRNGKIVCRVCVVDVVVLPENLCELGNQQLILFHDLLLAPWELLVVVVPRRVPRPDHEVDSALEVLLDPLESRVEKGYRGITVGRLCAIDSRRPMSSVTGRSFLRGGVCLVERIEVEVWSSPSVFPPPHMVIREYCSTEVDVPVMCRNLPFSLRPRESGWAFILATVPAPTCGAALQHMHQIESAKTNSDCTEAILRRTSKMLEASGVTGRIGGHG